MPADLPKSPSAAAGISINGRIISSSRGSMTGSGFSTTLRMKYGDSWRTADARRGVAVKLGHVKGPIKIHGPPPVFRVMENSTSLS